MKVTTDAVQLVWWLRYCRDIRLRSSCATPKDHADYEGTNQHQAQVVIKAAPSNREGASS